MKDFAFNNSYIPYPCPTPAPEKKETHYLNYT